jgi:hypothetical protein
MAVKSGAAAYFVEVRHLRGSKGDIPICKTGKTYRFGFQTLLYEGVFI